MTDQPLVLLIAYHFPPENAVGGLRPFRFCKYLPEYGYRCHVITAAEQGNAASIAPPLPCPVTYVPDSFPRKNAVSLRWQAERALRKFVLPGAVGTGWALQAAKAGKRILAGYPKSPVTVLSTFPPLGTHLAGWKLIKDRNVPWVADLRDPFPLGETRRARMIWDTLERRSFARCDAVIANTETAQAALQKRHPAYAAKIHCIPNGFDPAERMTPLPVAPDSPPSLSHVGELYAGRTATAVLESIARSLAAGRLSPGEIRVQLVGPSEPSCLPPLTFLEEATRSGWLLLRSEQVAKEEAVRIARTSDRLLLLQPHTAVQIPAKLFEYVQIGRPILAFLQRNSPSEGILRQSGVPYRTLYPDMDRNVFDQTVLDFLYLPSAPSRPAAWFEESFNVRQQTRVLADLLTRLRQ